MLTNFVSTFVILKIMRFVVYTNVLGRNDCGRARERVRIQLPPGPISN